MFLYIFFQNKRKKHAREEIIAGGKTGSLSPSEIPKHARASSPAAIVRLGEIGALFPFADHDPVRPRSDSPVQNSAYTGTNPRGRGLHAHTFRRQIGIRHQRRPPPNRRCGSGAQHSILQSRLWLRDALHLRHGHVNFYPLPRLLCRTFMTGCSGN